MRNRVNRAFTLIELLIVVAIIAILAAIAIPNFLDAQVRSKVSRVKADQRTIATALESYRVDSNHYPPWRLPDGTRISPVMRRYAMLTTPVAYMSSVPFDVFWAGREADIPTVWGAPVMDYLTIDNLPGAFWTAPDRMGHLWFVISFGPDAVKNPIVVNGGSSNIHYDPTNGTVSAGDICRFGP